MVFTASLFGARHLGEVVEKKPASLLVVSLGKALNGTPSPLCGRQVAQFSLQREGWWQEGHPTVKQMPCYKMQISDVATTNREKAERQRSRRRRSSLIKYFKNLNLSSWRFVLHCQLASREIVADFYYKTFAIKFIK